MSGFYSTIFSGFNPYVGVGTGTSVGAVFMAKGADSVVAYHQSQVCSKISLQRFTRLADKINDIKLKAAQVKNSWAWGKNEVLNQLGKTVIYFSNGIDSIDPE